MTLLIGSVLVLAALAGSLVVFNRDPKRQVFAISANGVVLSLLFFVLQAPDVALSEIVVGGAATPLLFLVALAAARMNKGSA
jgi:energy-converting hydrogenase B subunit D